MNALSPKEESELVSRFLKSEYWPYLLAVIESRKEAVITQKNDLRLSQTARIVLDGRLIELRQLVAFFESAAHSLSAMQKVEREEEIRKTMRARYPDI